MTIIIMQKTKSILFSAWLLWSFPHSLVMFPWFPNHFLLFFMVFPWVHLRFLFSVFPAFYAFDYNIKRSWIEPMVCVFLKYNFFIESKMCFRLIFTSIVNCYYYGIYTVPHLVSFTSSTYLRIDVLIILCNSADFKIYILWWPP